MKTYDLDNSNLAVAPVTFQKYKAKRYGKSTVQYPGENNCAPIALSAVLNKPYNQVNNYLLAKGYRVSNSRGTYTQRFMMAHPNLFEKIDFPLGTMSVTQVALQFPEGRYLVRVKRHALAVIEGVVFNTVMKGYRGTVLGIYRLVDPSKISL